MSSRQLPFDEEPGSVESRIDARDRAGRARGVDPRFNVALEASAGTGKTRVLVDRYVNLLREGVDPSNILAITFTRKAAAEMRGRIVSTLRAAAERADITAARWRELRDRTGDIAISTIDAFCLSLLREFPLEADLDPGFSMADDTEVPRLIDESLDRALRTCRAVARADEHVALVFAQLGDRRARAGLAALLNRRIVAPAVLSRYLEKSPRDLTVALATRRGAEGIIDVFRSMRGGLDRFLETGPPEPGFVLLGRHLRRLDTLLPGHRRPEGLRLPADVPPARLSDDLPLPADALDPAAVQAAFAHVREYFLTQDGEPRSRMIFSKDKFTSPSDWQTHRDLVIGHARAVVETYAAYRRDLNALVSRGVWRMFGIAEAEYRRTLEAHAVIDFSEVLLRALYLLGQMEEFAQSRYRLEARYHHVLVDEFQDTSRAQWQLVSLLITSWGEGAGLSHSGPLRPSIFIVGDRKQSIYGFRDAEASVLREASRHLDSLRPGGDVRRTISRSFRSVPALLAFVNDVCHEMEKAPGRQDAFRYEEEDRFPIDSAAAPERSEALGLVVADTPEACADMTAHEIARLIAERTTIRDRDSGVPRPVRPGDVAILFRTRESHREFEDALERRGIPAYVYKGLGFFDADEIKDILALLWYFADPLSDLRAAAWMRSRFVRMSDEALRLLAPRLADALRLPEPPLAASRLDASDASALATARTASSRWHGLVDRLPPAELLDVILRESAYQVEMRGRRFPQARENVKKIRALIRRIQNRGYVTLGRIAAHLDRLAVGDEANAVVDALDAVNLMTVHAAKGLEFPVVFLVNLGRGTGNRRDPIRIAADAAGDTVSVAVGDFQSDADEDDATRDREETKRLFYVAVTRARDRLYLGSVLKDGRIQPGRGSLAEVLPASLLEQFSAAATGVPTVQWRTASGTVHAFLVGATGTAVGAAFRRPSDDSVPHLEEGRLKAAPTCVAAAPTGVASDFAPLEDAALPRHTVAVAVFGDDLNGARPGGGRESDRLVGTLVHRLLQRAGAGAQLDDAKLSQEVSRVLRHDEEADVSDRAVLFEDVIRTYRALGGRHDIRELYASGEVLHEIPFTMHVDGRFVRGTIDCLVRTAHDRVTILEFKTGRRRFEHQAQVAIYRQAAQAVFAGATVDTRLIYAGGNEDSPPTAE